jgi:DNA-binding transcriptional MerR regulator
MKIISQVAAKFGLSRSTLLYYDRIGLCRPTYRTAAGYRLYADEEIQALELIRQYRQSGMSIRDIKDLLEDHETGQIADALNRQLDQLNAEIGALRRQQSVILSLLKDNQRTQPTRIMDKESWVGLLKSCGMNDEDMWRWHVMFEKQSPEAHQDFLESLSIPDKEIRSIRRKAQCQKND